MNTLEKVYKVFGDKLPERHEYAATDASPVTVLDITKEFRTWKAFEYEYNTFIQSKRVTQKVVTKAPQVKKEVKNVKQKDV